MSANFIGSASRSRPEWDRSQNSTDAGLAQHRDLAQTDEQRTAAEHHLAKVTPILSVVDTDQFACAIEEIEQAAAALRAGEPDLEPWRPNATAVQEHHPPRSIWL